MIYLTLRVFSLFRILSHHFSVNQFGVFQVRQKVTSCCRTFLILIINKLKKFLRIKDCQLTNSCLFDAINHNTVCKGHSKSILGRNNLGSINSQLLSVHSISWCHFEITCYGCIVQSGLLSAVLSKTEVKVLIEHG
jgi:hypothetical protein